MAVSVSIEAHESDGYQELTSPRFAIRIPPGEVPDWAPAALRMLEQYQDNPATPRFGPGHKIGAGMPIDMGTSVLEGFLLAAHPSAERLLVIGVSNRERLASDRVQTEVLLELFQNRNPHLVTDPARGDAFDDPEFDAAFEALVSEDVGSGLALSGGLKVVRAGPATVVQCGGTVRERLTTVGVEQLRKGAEVSMSGPFRELRVRRGDALAVVHPSPDRCEATLTDAELDALDAWPADAGLCVLGGHHLTFQDVSPDAPVQIVNLILTRRGGTRTTMSLGLGAVADCELEMAMPDGISNDQVLGVFSAAVEQSAAQPLREGFVVTPPEPVEGVARFVLVDKTDDHSDVKLFHLVPEGAEIDEAESVPRDGLPMPAPVHYNFAHKVLPAMFSLAPKETGAMLHHKADDTLVSTWKRTQDLLEAAAEPHAGLELVERDVLGPLAIFVVKMPPPRTVTEAYYVALAYQDAATFRYLVWERTMDDGAKLGEWIYRDGKPAQRLSGSRSSDVSLAEFKRAYRAWLAGDVPARDRAASDAAPTDAAVSRRSSLDWLLLGAVVVLLGIAAAAWTML